jgi:hypothetical protein
MARKLVEFNDVAAAAQKLKDAGKRPTVIAIRDLLGVVSENGIYGHSRFCNTDFDDKLACLNLSGV